MSRPALLSLTGAALLGVAASTVSCGVPYEHDAIAVTKRYAHQYDGPCSSWLRSYKTGYKYCASPALGAIAVTPPPAPAPAAAPKVRPASERVVELAALRAEGEEHYKAICQACHGADGKGIPGAFPPLDGSGGFYGEPQNMARIIVHGLTGEITVQGQTFNGAMPPQGAVLDDYAIAAVATYVRTSWSNADGIVTPDDVKAVR